MSNRTPTSTVLAAIVALVFIGAALVVGVALTGDTGSKTTPFVAQILALIGVVIPILVGAARAETLSKDIKNGAMKEPVKEALREHDFEPDLTPLVERLTARLEEPWDGTERRKDS